MKRNQSILFHCADTQLYQVVTSYLNLLNFRVIASAKPQDVLQKIDRQKFHAILVGTNSEPFLDEFLFSLSEKSNLNQATPVVLINNPAENMQIEEKLGHRIKYIIDTPFTLATISQSLLLSVALGNQ